MVFYGVYEFHDSFGPATAKTVQVPDLTGKNEAAADADLQRTVWSRARSQKGNSSKPKGTVYHQSAVPGASAKPKTAGARSTSASARPRSRCPT